MPGQGPEPRWHRVVRLPFPSQMSPAMTEADLTLRNRPIAARSAWPDELCLSPGVLLAFALTFVPSSPARQVLLLRRRRLQQQVARQLQPVQHALPGQLRPAVRRSRRPLDSLPQRPQRLRAVRTAWPLWQPTAGRLSHGDGSNPFQIRLPRPSPLSSSLPPSSASALIAHLPSNLLVNSPPLYTLGCRMSYMVYPRLHCKRRCPSRTSGHLVDAPSLRLIL
jgi:hypothetical protein